MSAVLNIAGYKFVPLADLPERREALRQLSLEQGLKGTILLSPEGINLFLSGEAELLREWLARVKADPLMADLHVKESYSQSIPFKRMLVKIKREIIPFGVDAIEPHRETSPKLKPAELQRWIEEGRDMILLDVRNDFEVAVGTFAGAIPSGIQSFRDFEQSLDNLPEAAREKPIVMFCTGGVRCEKAGPLMQRHGFAEVYQLDGGILQYFEDCGGAHYRGDCFVFDSRVAVDSGLGVSGLAQCYVCQAILSREDQQSSQYVVGQSCPHCYRSPDQRRHEAMTQRQATIADLAQDLPGCRPHDQRRPVRIPERLDGRPLLECFIELFPQVERREWELAFDESRILDGSVSARAARRVRSGEQFVHCVPGFVEPPVNGEIELLWEDEAIVVVNKPAPLPVHASGRFHHNTLLSLLGRVYQPQVLRAAHRLDANTTGAIVLCRSRAITRVLQRQFESRAVDKEYVLRCIGHPPQDAFICTAPIGIQEGAGRIRRSDSSGAAARTEFRVLARYGDGTALLAAHPITGRTNQIRVHLWEMGFPVLGDPLYLPSRALGANVTLDPAAPAMCLHSRRLTFVHPVTEETVTFEAPLPAWA